MSETARTRSEPAQGSALLKSAAALHSSGSSLVTEARRAAGLSDATVRSPKLTPVGADSPVLPLRPSGGLQRGGGMSSPKQLRAGSSDARPVRDLSKGPILLGVCAMEKKARSSVMMETLSRIKSFKADGMTEFEVVLFEEKMLLVAPVEEWPLCEAMIAFFSGGFPLRKAQEYVALRKPFFFNDLEKQEWLFDRRVVYSILEAIEVPVPKHVVYNADDPSPPVIEDNEEYLQVGGIRISKPLVEKPVSGEDHNIYLYYPRSQGGGSKRLFRKVGDRSSAFYPDVHATRVRDGNSYIYEELLLTEGTDVKVYAVGPDYAHAEARKSPVIDGRVMRNKRGKEVRYPVILNAEEKEIARKVVLAFGQTVCGFDILRSYNEAEGENKSYVCDVNGWSFVKDSQKYLQDSASLLREYTLKALAPRHLEHHPIACDGISQGVHSTSSLPNFATLPLSSAEPQPKGEDAGELLCVVAFTRHGDRTPKQKLKFATTEPTLLAMISEFGTSPRDELKVKKIHLMEELLRRVEAILSRLEAASEREDADDGMAEVDKFIAVRQVLKAYPFTGINRKVQLKPTKWAPPAPIEAATFSTAAEAAEAARRAAPPIEAQFILKWGGELTVLGQAQATRLGAQFRSTLYPGEVDGVLRLHATYRHDLKIYTSDEGRVQMTAAAFTKGFLDLEGQLTPILASLVSKNKTVTSMLDDTPDTARSQMDLSKAIIHTTLSSTNPLSESDHEASGHELRLPEAALPTPVLAMHVPSPVAGAADALARSESAPSIAVPVPLSSSSPAVIGGPPADASPPAVPRLERTSSTPASPALSGTPSLEKSGVLLRGLFARGERRSNNAEESEPDHHATVAPLIEAIEAGDHDLHNIMPQMSLRGSSGGQTSAPNPRGTLHRLRELVEMLTAELRDKAHQSRGDLTDLDLAGEPCLEGLHPTMQGLTRPTCLTPPPAESRARTNAEPGGAPQAIDRAALASVAPSPTRPPMIWTNSRLEQASSGAPSSEVAKGSAAAAAAAAAAVPEAGEPSRGEEEPISGSSTAKAPLPLAHPANGETPLLHYGRWAKLRREFYKSKKATFDTTKIPDLYDNAMYDMIHNQHLRLHALPALYVTAKAIASYVVPQEYGAEPEDKVRVGVIIGGEMVTKLNRDLIAGMDTGDHHLEARHQLDHSIATDVNSTRRHVRTRLYFTSESHMHSLFNILRWGSTSEDNVPTIFSDECHSAFDRMELGYLTHIVFRVLLKNEKGATGPRASRVPSGGEGEANGCEPIDPTKKASYVVQVLASPGIEHHQRVCDASAESYSLGAGQLQPGREREQKLFEQLSEAAPMLMASSDDLTLEEVNDFFTQVERAHQTQTLPIAPNPRHATYSQAGDTRSPRMRQSSASDIRSVGPTPLGPAVKRGTDPRNTRTLVGFLSGGERVPAAEHIFADTPGSAAREARGVRLGSMDSAGNHPLDVG